MNTLIGINLNIVSNKIDGINNSLTIFDILIIIIRTLGQPQHYPNKDSLTSSYL